MLSSHGGKSQKSKLQDCLSLFEALYEKQNNLTQNSQTILSSHKDFDFDACRLEFSSEQLNLNIFGNRLSTLEMTRKEYAELKRLSFDKWWISEVWRGNILNIINEFKEQSNLDDFLF